MWFIIPEDAGSIYEWAMMGMRFISFCRKEKHLN